MALGSRVTVGNTPTVLIAEDDVSGAATREKRGADYGVGRFLLRNKGVISIDLGSAAVASGSGFELAAGEAVSMEFAFGDSLYGITASSTCRVDVLKVNP